MSVRFLDTISVIEGGSGPNPTDSFSIGIKLQESVPGSTDAVSFAFTFPDTIGTQSETVKLGLNFEDTTSEVTDALLSLGLGLNDTIGVASDVASYLVGMAYADTLTAPSETVGIRFGYPDSFAAPSDARISTASFWLTGSAGAGVTNPTFANGLNDGTIAVVSTAPAGSAIETLTSNVGNAIPAGTPLNSAVYQGWFRARTTVNTSFCKLLGNSSSALFSDFGMFTLQVNAGDVNHLTGTFTFDLVAAGVNTLAKLQSFRVLFRTSDAAAGVTPAILDVDAGRITMTNVF